MTNQNTMLPESLGPHAKSKEHDDSKPSIEDMEQWSGVGHVKGLILTNQKLEIIIQITYHILTNQKSV